MAQQNDKDPKSPNEPKAQPPTVTSGNETGKPAPDVEHEYDPVGMAGKKAGIVEEIEQDLKEEDKEKRTGRKA